MLSAIQLRYLLRLLCLCTVCFAVSERCLSGEDIGSDVTSALQVSSAVVHRKPSLGAILPQPLVVDALKQDATKQAPKEIPASKSAPVELLSPSASSAPAVSVAAQAAPIPASQQILVSVPADASPGDQIQATSPDGQTLQFALPAGVKPGQEVPILYTPLAVQNQQQQVVATPVQQPVMMVDESSAGTSQILQTASIMQSGGLASQALLGNAASAGAGTGTMSLQAMHAMSDANAQKDAIKKVMEEYSVMQNMDEDQSDEEAELAYAKAEQAKHNAEWEAAADMDAAAAAEDVASYKAEQRHNALHDAAFAKNELAQRMGEYTVAKANSVQIAGTDAAWKATVVGAVPPPEADPQLQMHAPIMAEAVA